MQLSPRTPKPTPMTKNKCKSIGCANSVSGSDFCEPCLTRDSADSSLSDRYPEQYRSLGDLAEIDVFAVHHLFQIQDPSGCLQHASRVLLSSGQPDFRAIREARDTLTRWLQLNKELSNA